MRVRDIMTSNPQVVTADEPLSRAATIMRDYDIGLVPVVDDRSHMRLTGVITDRDIAVRCVAEQHEPSCRVRDHMTMAPVEKVRADADVSEAVTAMERDRVRRVPVVDERDHLTGIVTQADLARKVGPDNPVIVEHVLERISEPTRAASAG